MAFALITLAAASILVSLSAAYDDWNKYCVCCRPRKVLWDMASLTMEVLSIIGGTVGEGGGQLLALGIVNTRILAYLTACLANAFLGLPIASSQALADTFNFSLF
ncbi:MAG: hypothetical protein ABF449_13155 [Ethanoligenens sp.]